MKSVFSLGLTAALGLASAAFAADSAPAARADANADGAVTLQESQAALRARLSRFDADGDGRVSREELQAGRQQRRLDREARWAQREDRRGAAMFERLDADHNGQLSPSEFEAGRERLREHRREGRNDRAQARSRMHAEGRFAALDANRDGAVDTAEMDRAAAQRFARMDVDRDGRLTAAERPVRHGPRRHGAAAPPRS